MSDAPETEKPAPGLFADLLILTKFRLSFLVLTTTLTGFLMRSTAGWNSVLMLDVLIGSTMAAFGAAVFNQLLEIEPDALMKRTKDRPLPAGRMSPAMAFVAGTLLAGLGVLHLAMRVNLESSLLAAATLGIYIFIYTPMKRVSSWNTVVGAVAGALPPLIGWTGAAGPPLEGESPWRNSLYLEPGALYLFLLLFFWQMPHFIAINWMYREEYEKAGHVMWSGGDESGAKSSRLIFLNSLALTAVTLWPVFSDQAAAWSLLPFGVIDAILLWLAFKFVKSHARKDARNVFLYTTVLWLPVALLASIFCWRS